MIVRTLFDESVSPTNNLYETVKQILNLNTSASGNNPIIISSTNTTANNCIWFQNNLSRNAYIGVPGSAFTGGGNYTNNLFIENANGSIILNSQGRTSTSKWIVE